MNTKEYNGWTNYETWLVNLWLGNEESSVNEVRGIVRYSHSRSQLAKLLKEYVEELVQMPESGFAADLMNSALSEVNWYELAEAYWVDEAEEEESEEE